ncbi:MAG: DUF1552 domain-containing protein [Nannocystaceae bacterium]
MKTRRQLLRHWGTGLASLPLLTASGTWSVSAAARGLRASDPTRLILFPALNGVEDQYFWPQGGNLPLAVEPLADFADQMMFVRGLDTAGSFNHMAIRSMFTGAPIADYASADPGVKSVDQVIADHFGDTSPSSLRSLHLGAIPASSIEYYQLFGRSTFFFNPEPVDYDANPVTAFDKIFGSLGAPPPDDEEEVAGFEADVLALTRKEVERLRARVASSPAERQKLDTHLGALKLLAAPGGPNAPIGCEGSTLDSVEKLRPTLQGNEPGAYQFALYSDIMDAQIDTLARAVVCGMTRVATLQANSADGNVTVPVLGGRPHHDTSHASGADFAVLVQWYAGKMARLLKALDVPDPLDPGNTVLHNSCVLWLSECNPGHDSNDVPAFYAGTAGGRLKTGSLVDADGATNRHLLRTLCDVMGAPEGASAHFGGETLSEIKA